MRVFAHLLFAIEERQEENAKEGERRWVQDQLTIAILFIECDLKSLTVVKQVFLVLEDSTLLHIIVCRGEYSDQKVK